MCDAVSCSRPSPAPLCADCRNRLVRALRDIAGMDGYPPLLAEINRTITRGDSMTSNTLGIIVRGSDKPLPFNDAATETRLVLRRVVARAVRVMLHHYGHLRCVAANVTAAAEWLAIMPGLLAEHPLSGSIHDQVCAAVREVYRAIDRPPQRVYVGRCDVVVRIPLAPCRQELYAVEGYDTVECSACGTTWGVAEQRAWLENRLVDELAPASDLVGLVVSLGRHLTTPMIRSWKRRGLLEVAAVDDKGRDLFRVGDVLDRLAATNNGR